ncbi:hypothetical protein Tco_0432472 [Tanacetum coccineum]
MAMKILTDDSRGFTLFTVIVSSEWIMLRGDLSHRLVVVQSMSPQSSYDIVYHTVTQQLIVQDTRSLHQSKTEIWSRNGSVLKSLWQRGGWVIFSELGSWGLCGAWLIFDDGNKEYYYMAQSRSYGGNGGFKWVVVGSRRLGAVWSGSHLVVGSGRWVGNGGEVSVVVMYIQTETTEVVSRDVQEMRRRDSLRADGMGSIDIVYQGEISAVHELSLGVSKWDINGKKEESCGCGLRTSYAVINCVMGSRMEDLQLREYRERGGRNTGEDLHGDMTCVSVYRVLECSKSISLHILGADCRSTTWGHRYPGGKQGECGREEQLSYGDGRRAHSQAAEAVVTRRACCMGGRGGERQRTQYVSSRGILRREGTKGLHSERRTFALDLDGEIGRQRGLVRGMARLDHETSCCVYGVMKGLCKLGVTIHTQGNCSQERDTPRGRRHATPWLGVGIVEQFIIMRFCYGVQYIRSIFWHSPMLVVDRRDHKMRTREYFSVGRDTGYQHGEQILDYVRFTMTALCNRHKGLDSIQSEDVGDTNEVKGTQLEVLIRQSNERSILLLPCHNFRGVVWTRAAKQEWNASSLDYKTSCVLNGGGTMGVKTSVNTNLWGDMTVVDLGCSTGGGLSGDTGDRGSLLHMETSKKDSCTMRREIDGNEGDNIGVLTNLRHSAWEAYNRRQFSVGYSYSTLSSGFLLITGIVCLGGNDERIESHNLLAVEQPYRSVAQQGVDQNLGLYVFERVRLSIVRKILAEILGVAWLTSLIYGLQGCQVLSIHLYTGRRTLREQNFFMIPLLLKGNFLLNKGLKLSEINHLQEIS